MKDFKIDYASQTIEMSKKFAKAAGEFGSYEYKTLQQVRTENSGFHIAILIPRAAKTQLLKAWITIIWKPTLLLMMMK